MKKEFSKFLTEFMENNNYKLEYISTLTGASLSAIGHYKTGERTPKDDFIENFIKAFNIGEIEAKKIKMLVMEDRTPEPILKKIKKLENQLTGNAKILVDEDFIDIPVRAKAAAGNGYINLEECIYTIKVRRNGYHKDCYVIEVAGSSMEPLIDDGAFVIVDPLQTQYIKDKVYVVKYNDEVYIKKVEIDEKSNFMVLKSVNPNYENLYIPGNEAQLVTILGRAIKFYHEGNL
ncbi:MAG: LexA family transcriptional regulator [Fusobacteriaceae bacterium]